MRIEYLVGGFKHCFFHNIWDNPSHWLICFKMVKTTNQCWKQCWATNFNAQKWHLQRAFLKTNRKKIVCRRQGFCLQKRCQNNFKHHTCKNERPREINMNMVQQNFQSKANRLEELKNVYRLFPFSCPTPTFAAVEQVQWAVVRCCICFGWFL